jgi:hypothetical protein
MPRSVKYVVYDLQGREAKRSKLTAHRSGAPEASMSSVYLKPDSMRFASSCWWSLSLFFST